ncbi:hypothetical protein Tco_0316132 [Tanacetum coccineum]
MTDLEDKMGHVYRLLGTLTFEHLVVLRLKALYGRKLGRSVLWAEMEREKIIKRRETVKKSYANIERKPLRGWRLRLLEELSSVHDTFHVSNLKKCLADANLHVPLEEIKVDKIHCSFMYRRNLSRLWNEKFRRS